MLTLIPLMLGLVVENKRLSSDWPETLIKVLWALIFSLFAFFPSLTVAEFDMALRIKLWPCLFIFFFTILSFIWQEERAIPKLNEGTVLVQSISVLYWMINSGLLKSINGMNFIIISMVTIFCLSAAVYAIFNLKPYKNLRLVLSIWSAMIMVLFGLDHIYKVFSFESTTDYSFVRNGLDYFLLGVTLIFIFQNALMLITYLPGRGRPYGIRHLGNIKVINETHRRRYSQKSIQVNEALVIVLSTVGLYFLNYSYQWLPANNVIWLLFWIFPYIIKEESFTLR